MLSRISRLSVPLVAAVIAFSPNASAQEPRGAQTSNQVFLPAPRALKQRLARAQKALVEERFSDAVTDLGEVLVTNPEDSETALEMAEQDYFISSSADANVQTSLRAEVVRLIGSLPDKGREIYELQFGVEARTLLNVAVDIGDTSRLSEVIRKYFHTDAGYEAAMVLGRWHLDQNRPLAAALTFRRVLQSPRAAGKFDPELSLLLAASWKYAGQTQNARDVLIDLKRRNPSAKFRLNGERVVLFANDEQALPWLDKIVGTVSLMYVEQQSQWTVFRGNASRNGQTSGSAPLLHPRWRAMVVNDFSDEQLVSQLQKRNLDQNLSSIPSLQPLAVGDMVLMRTPDQLVGVDFRTGKIVWVYPWIETTETSTSANMRGEGRGGASSQRETELNQRMWEDWAFGQFSSDGESVFVLEKMGIATSSRFGPRMIIGPGGMARLNPGYPTSNNQLVALDLKRQGALRWTVGDETGWDEPKLAGAFFLGSPLPLQDKLHALVELNGEIRLVVLDAKTGALEWSQQIAHVETRPILIDGVRRLAGATPSYSDGILVCPTSAGAVVAIDLATRSLLWGHQYATAGLDGKNFESGYNRSAQNVSRWLDATVSISDGRVLLTPVDSNELLCLDLLTGKPLWTPKRREQNLSDMLYVGCVHNGVGLLVGRRSLVGLRLHDGKEAWKQPIELRTDRGEYASGRGFYSDHYYYLPTSASQLLKIDLEKGEVVERITTAGTLGNLVCYRDQVISLGLNYLTVHYQIEPLRKRVDEALLKNGVDSWALARRGELLLHDNKPREAFESLLKSRQINPSDDGIASLLVDSFLAALERDFSGTRGYAAQVEPLMAQMDQQAKFLRLYAAGSQKSGDIAGAFDASLKLADLSSEDGASGDNALEDVEPGWRLHRDRWVRSRLAELLSAAEPTVRAQMDKTIQSRFADAVSSPTPAALRRFVAHFESHSLANQARLKLAERLVRTDDFLEAELLLLSITSDSDSSEAAAANAQLAGLFEASHRDQEAADTYRHLAERWPDQLCTTDKTGRQLLESLADDSPVRRFLQPPTAWPDGLVMSKETPNDEAVFPSRSQPAQFIQVRNSSGAYTSSAVEFDAGRSLLVMRDRFGNETARVSVPESLRVYAANATAKRRGHLILFSPGLHPLAIDLFRAFRSADEAVLWPRDQPDMIGAPSSGNTTIQIVNNGNPFETRGDPQGMVTGISGVFPGSLGPVTRHGVIWLARALQCVDPISGQVLWIRNNVPTNAEILGDEQVVALINRQTNDVLAPANEVTLWNTADGRELARRRLPEHGGRWTTCGRNVLLWNDLKDSQVLQLWDVVTGEAIWSESFKSGSRGVIVAGDEVAVVQPDGKCLIRSLQHADRRLETIVDAETNLTGIYVLRSSDGYHLIVNRVPPSPPAPQNRGLGLFVFGKIYAMDRESGAMQWPAPSIMESASLPLNQPPDSPMLTFYGQASIAQLQKAPRNSLMYSVVCLDKRTGRHVFSKRDIPPTPGSGEITVDQSAKMVRLGLGQQKFEITYTSEPRPPEPPLQNWSPIGKD